MLDHLINPPDVCDPHCDETLYRLALESEGIEQRLGAIGRDYAAGTLYGEAMVMRLDIEGAGCWRIAQALKVYGKPLAHHVRAYEWWDGWIKQLCHKMTHAWVPTDADLAEVAELLGTALTEGEGLPLSGELERLSAKVPV